jgi:hypothetical protein
MNILKIIGALIFIVGVVDVGGSFMDFDMWGKIGVQLPDILWKYSGYIELILGGFLFNLGSGDSEEEETES